MPILRNNSTDLNIYGIFGIRIGTQGSYLTAEDHNIWICILMALSYYLTWVLKRHISYLEMV